MTEPIIRKATEDDLPVLILLEQQTFIGAFKDAYAKEDLTAFLRQHKSVEAITQHFHTPGTSYYLIRIDKKDVGFLQLNLNRQPDDGTLLPEPVMQLEKIYLLPGFTGGGIGRIMIHFVLSVARKNHVKSLWLGVWENNPRAKAFYESEGFTVFGEHMFPVGSQTDRDLLMARQV